VDTDPYDPAWEGKFVGVDDTPSDAAVWLLEGDWTERTVGGLQPETAYTFDAQAINSDGITTPFGPDATLATLGGGFAIGDMNCDGEIDFNDINPFVLALSVPASYTEAYPDCELMNGDINEDGELTFADINPFVLLLAGP
jgi:hypothetical protein